MINNNTTLENLAVEEREEGWGVVAREGIGVEEECRLSGTFQDV